MTDAASKPWLALAVPLALAAVDSRAEDAVRATGDAARGARAFQQCYACHSVQPGETDLPGPNLAGIVGRRAAADAGFDYSAALRAAGNRGLAWTPAELDAFLRDPEAHLPGTSMSYPGLRDPVMRADLLAYLLQRASVGPEP